MADITRKIGLSLGADICWAACYEKIIEGMNLSLPVADDLVRFQVSRVQIEPFNLRQPCNHDVVIDRLTHWFMPTREWIKKAVIMDGLYVLNNPWSIQANEKHSTYAAMMHLGLNVPETVMLPPKDPHEHTTNVDMDVTLKRYGKLFDLGEVGRNLGFPAFIKPYDGGAWVGVSKVENEAELKAAYDESGGRVMHLQKAIMPFDLFVRTVGIGPQVEVMRYNPSAPLHARYMVDFFFVNGEEWSLLQDQMITINSFFGWDFNSCESLRQNGVFYPIDFANACPDFQVTSLHFHFPNLVKNMIRWSLFCAATDRKVKPNLDWSPYYEVVKKDLPFRERLREYAKIGHQRFETDRFQDFCQQHLSQLDEVAWEFFGTSAAREIFRQKVAALFPKHEVEEFTDHYFGLVQFWRKTEADRLNRVKAAQGAKAE